VATTNAGGAGKWRAGYEAALRGARVAVVPDHDDAGRAHGRRVAAALAPVTAELAVVELAGLPEKGDVSDWIAARRREGGGNAELARELMERAAAAGAAVLCTGETAREREALPELAASARRESTAAGGGSALRSSRMSEVEARQVHFLWRPYLPLGKLTLLEGDPGQGKSWVTAAIAACGSVGRGLPGMEAFEPFASLFFSTEDGKADTFRPRLDALGADSARVYGHDQPLYLDTPEGMAEMEREIAGRGPRLVVIDSVMSFVGARVDVYRANEVRAVLAPLAKLGERYGCAILALRHITKSRGGRAIYAGMGSIDFTATARSVLLAGSSAHDPGEHALLHIKSNVSALGASLGYRVDEGGFSWTGVTHLTAADLLAAETAGEERAADEEARRFLSELLAAAPLPARHVFEEAKKAGISEITLRRAKAREGVIVEKVGFQEGTRWVWSIPSTSRRRS
jgi:putative DNA primase/helicase